MNTSFEGCFLPLSLALTLWQNEKKEKEKGKCCLITYSSRRGVREKGDSVNHYGLSSGFGVHLPVVYILLLMFFPDDRLLYVVFVEIFTVSLLKTM